MFSFTASLSGSISWTIFSKLCLWQSMWLCESRRQVEWAPLAFVARGGKFSENVLSPMYCDMLAGMSGHEIMQRLSDPRFFTPNTKDRTVIAPVTSSTLLAASLFELLRSWTTFASIQGCDIWQHGCVQICFLSPCCAILKRRATKPCVTTTESYRAPHTRFLGMV